MTIKIKAYQRHGMKTEERIDEFEFCCWKELRVWLNGYPRLYDCSKCRSKKEAITKN